MEAQLAAAGALLANGHTKHDVTSTCDDCPTQIQKLFRR
jgi:hypothetical protein